MCGVPVRSFVWLRRLDVCEESPFRVEARERTGVALPGGRNDLREIEFLVSGDREAGPFSDVGDDATDEVVQRGAQAVDVISADDAELDGRWGLDRYADAIAASIVVGVSPIGQGFSIEVGADFACEGHQMCVRSI